MVVFRLIHIWVIFWFVWDCDWFCWILGPCNGFLWLNGGRMFSWLGLL